MQKNTQLSLWWKAKSSSYENCPRDSSLFSSWRNDCAVPKQSRVSEVLKGLTYMILSITVKEITI